MNANARLQYVQGPEERDDYDQPTGNTSLNKWTGDVGVRVVDRVKSAASLQGGLMLAHMTEVYIPARIVADQGGYLALSVDDVLIVEQDGTIYNYRVQEWEDWGERRIGTPTRIRVVVERTDAE